MVPAVSTTGNSPTPSSRAPAWANNYDNNTLSPVPVTAVQSQKQQQNSPPPAFVVSSTTNPVPHQYHHQTAAGGVAAGTAAAVVSPSNNSDGRYYHSPALSPGDWNVASPNSYMSDTQQQLQQQQRYSARNNNPGASPSAVLSPNTAPPGQVYHYQQQPQHNSSSPSTQSTWSMSSSSASSPSSINNTSSPDMMNQHNMMLQQQQQQVVTSPSGNAVPPALPTNLGEQQQQQPPSGQQEGQKESPEARGRVSSADVQKIQKSFMVKTSLDTGREQVASRRALDLIDVVAGKASNRSLSSSGGIKQKRSFQFQHPNSRSSASKRMSARGMSAYQRSSRAAATANSSTKAAAVAADVMKELGSAAPAAGAPHRRASAPQVVVSSDGSSIARGKPSLGKLTSMATSTWSKKKKETGKSEEVTYRETVHDYKTSHDRDRETWAKNKALEMLRPDRHPFNIPGAA